MLRARWYAVQSARRAAGSPCHGGRGRGREASALAKPLADSNCQLPITRSRFQGNHVVDQQRAQQTLQDRAKDVDASGARNDSRGRQDHDGEGRSLGMRQRTPGAALTTRLRGMFSHKGGGPWRLAVHVLEKGRNEGIKDAKAYNAVLKMIAVDEWMGEDKLKQMEGLFRQMKLDGLEPEVHTYNSLIHAYGQAGKGEGAVRLYEEMVRGGVLPDRRTLSSMIVAHSWRSVNCMRRVAAEMKSKGWLATRRAHSAMIGALHRVEDWKGVLDVAKTMVESKQTLTEAGFAVAMKGARRLGQADLGRRFLADYGKAKFRPKEALYASVMEAFRSAGRHEDCLACWRELVVLDGLGDVNVSERTYNLALRSAVRAECWEEMEGIFDMMQARGVEPNEETYRSLAGAPSGKTPGGVAPVDRTAGAVQEGRWRQSKEEQQQQQQQLLLRAAAVDRSSTSDRAWPRARALMEDARREPIAPPGAVVNIPMSRHPIEKSNGVALADERRPKGFELNEACGVGIVSAAPPSTAGSRIEAVEYLAEAKGWGLTTGTGGGGGAAALAAEGGDVVEIAGKIGGGVNDGGDGGGAEGTVRAEGGSVSKEADAKAGVAAGYPTVEEEDDYEHYASLRPENGAALDMGSAEAVGFGLRDPPACESPWFREAWSQKKLRKRDELLG